MLAFLLDVAEVPESHSGVTLAREFQDMLKRFGLTDKVLAVNADNASANNAQMSALSLEDNTFEEENRVRCFTHTSQLSAIALISSFNAGMTSKDTDIVGVEAAPIENDDEDAETAADEDKTEEDADDADDGVDELEEMSEADKANILQDTQLVRGTVSKVRSRLLSLSFNAYLSRRYAISHLPSYTLPRLCSQLGEPNVSSPTSLCA